MEKSSPINLPISLIIPYHNESAVIHLTIERILNQTKPPREVIFVNSSSTDNSSLILDQLISQHQNFKDITFRNIFANTNTPSSSKNAGVRESCQDWFAFMDCGLNFPANWLESMWDFVNQNKLGLASAVGIFKGEGLVDRCAIAQTYGYCRERSTVPSTIVSKETFYKIGFFKENRRAGYDVDWQLAIENKNITRGINRNIVFHYDGISFGNNLSFIIKKMIRYSAPTVGLDYYKMPYFYLLALILTIALSLYSLSSIKFLLILYVVLRGWILPLLKSGSFLIYKDEPLAVLGLPVVAFCIDTGRMIGVLKGVYLFHILPNVSRT